MIASLPKGLRCAELGVFAGHFSRDILHINQPSELYLVDLFEDFFTSGNQDGEAPLTMHMPTVEHMLRREFSNDCRVTIGKCDSVAWLQLAFPSSLDLVYIDTAHSYGLTKAEIAESLRVVRPGGWIAGHDYHERFPGVIQAVSELGLPVALTADGRPSWMVQRPARD